MTAWSSGSPRPDPNTTVGCDRRRRALTTTRRVPLHLGVDSHALVTVDSRDPRWPLDPARVGSACCGGTFDDTPDDDMGDKQIVVAIFPRTGPAATPAAPILKDWDKLDDDVKLNTIGVLVLNNGKVQTQKIGRRSWGKATASEWYSRP